jgi:hypothetical protein
MKMLQSLVLALLLIFYTGCSEDDIVDPPVDDPSADVHTIYNVPADTGNQNKITYFRFSDSTIVTGSDTATANWDIAFRATTIYTNSGSSGPGQGGAVVLTNADFNSVTKAPADGYNVDAAGAPAIPTGSDNGWYHYDAANFVIVPLTGVILAIRTGDGKYAKVQILSYYKDVLTNPSAADQARFYTFKYCYQPDGSIDFE